MRKSKIERMEKIMNKMASIVKAIIEDQEWSDHKKAEVLKEMVKTTAWRQGVKLYYGEIDYDDLDYDEEPEWFPYFPLDGKYNFVEKIKRYEDYFSRKDMGGQCDRAFVIAYKYGEKNGMPLYKTKVACDYYNRHWKIMEELADFRELAKMRDTSWEVQMSTPVRWLGAFNTGTEGDKEFPFEEVFEWETSRKGREIAAQLFEKIEEIGDSFKNGDSISYCKLGVIYSPEDVVEAYESDAYTRSLGPILIPSNDRTFYYRREYSSDSLLINIIEYFNSVYDIDTLDNFENNWDTYNYPEIKNISDVINDIFDEKEVKEIIRALTTSSYYGSSNRKRELKDARNAFKFIQHCIQTRECNIQWEFERRWHSEAIIAIGAKPQGIVVRGTISTEKYEIVQKIAIEKGLYILHV